MAAVAPEDTRRTLGDRLGPHLRGHLLLFAPRASPAYPAAAGIRLLGIVVLLEGLIGPRLWMLAALRLPAPPSWIRVPVLLALALVLVRFFAGVRPSQLGLRPWREWSAAERSYFVQICLIANGVFAMIFMPRLRGIAGPSVAVTVVTYLAWGFYQELIYRGILQTELTRRWGAVWGILASNLLYTFGPLHAYHLAGPSPAPMFAAIFAIGLFFGVLFARSGNLWLPGVFHGIGDAWITGLGG